MKRCPKCNRTYPDDNQKFCTVDGGLLAVDHFDPNATMQGTSVPLPAEKPTSRDLPDLNKTVAASQSAPTEVFQKQTGPTGGETILDARPQQYTSAPSPTKPQSAPLPGGPQSAPLPAAAVAPQKKSKLPLILGILVLLLVLGVGAVVAAFFLVIRPRMNEMQPERTVVTTTNDNENTAPNTNANTADETTTIADNYTPPPDAVKFTNSRANLDGKLAEHYVDFSFYYPKNWTLDPSSGSNFVKIEKTEEDEKGVYLLESASVNWYNSNGTFEADGPIFADRVNQMESQISPGFPGYRKVWEGETKINSLKAYEFRFTGTFKNTGKGDLPYWGRVFFVPAGDGKTSGAVITLLATSLSPAVSSVEDVGEKGETPVILESFRFAKNP